jgi:hypothetical protein
MGQSPFLKLAEHERRGQVVDSKLSLCELEHEGVRLGGHGRLDQQCAELKRLVDLQSHDCWPDRQLEQRPLGLHAVDALDLDWRTQLVTARQVRTVTGHVATNAHFRPAPL